jgi:hypothetical protein
MDQITSTSCICWAQRPKTLNERKNGPERVVALEKEPQREIRVMAVKENDHNAFWHYENTATRSGIMRISQCVVIVREAQILQKNNQPLTSKQLH